MKIKGTQATLQNNLLYSKYTHMQSHVEKNEDTYEIQMIKNQYTFKTNTKIPKLGLLLVGFGGNNGSTLLAGLLANKYNIKWHDKKGSHQPNFYGSITQSTTLKIGICQDQQVFVPLKDVLPLVDPQNITINGWDINDMNLGDAMKRAQVLDYDLQKKLYPYMKNYVPMSSIYYQDFIASNQKERANSINNSENKIQDLKKIRNDIKNFKTKQNLEKVIVLWTANTERFCNQSQVHSTGQNLMEAINQNHPEISPSIIFAVASILEGCSFINGSPQNTLVPGVIDLARKKNVFIVGNDFKSGQTKFKTNIVEFLVSAGIKPRSIVSYNHLGNNDGKNLSSQQQFKSKQISKKTCVDNILSSNQILYPESTQIDHSIVIKYLPFAGDSKKAMDQYMSQIFMNGTHTLMAYNVCQDSLLAAPIILDLVILTQLFERIEYKQQNKKGDQFKRFDSVLSFLGYLMKAPLTKGPVINSLGRQRQCIQNLFRVCAGIPLEDNLLLSFRKKSNQRKQIHNQQF